MPTDLVPLANWLLMRAIADADLGDTVRGLARKLAQAGIPVDRLAIGRSFLHPHIGLLDLIWDIDSDRVEINAVPRNVVTADTFRHSPFGKFTVELGRDPLVRRKLELALQGEGSVEDLPTISADLRDPDMRAQYPIFQTLFGRGLKGYFSFAFAFSMPTFRFEDGYKFAPGASVSFATRRNSGFSKDDESALLSLALPLVVCLRVTTERFLARELLGTYLGRNSGEEVLTGQIARGHVREIDCVLFYSDLRDSTSLSQRIEPRAYLDLLNRYFDCVAGAVLDQGGEVLKFIGDGILAIFPIGRDPDGAMCAAALEAARVARRRSDAGEAPVPFEFGIGLDVGQVFYGNVGTQTRLDFTVTGAAVARVSRLESLTRALGRPILATSAFAEHCAEPAQSLPPQTLRGFSESVGIVAYAV